MTFARPNLITPWIFRSRELPYVFFSHFLSSADPTQDTMQSADLIDQRGQQKILARIDRIWESRDYQTNRNVYELGSYCGL
jgi:hypothetical protein